MKDVIYTIGVILAILAGDIYAHDFRLAWGHSPMVNGNLVSCNVTGETSDTVVHEVPILEAGDTTSTLDSAAMPELVEDTQYDCEVRSYTTDTEGVRSVTGPSNVLRFWNEPPQELVSVPRAPTGLEMLTSGE